jgi:hypothetical protein
MTNNGYEIILADTEESKNIHYNLRYQIFCLEKGFEEAMTIMLFTFSSRAITAG